MRWGTASCPPPAAQSRQRPGARANAAPRHGHGSSRTDGPQFIARDFKTFLRTGGMTRVRTSPSDQQSNGELERYHRTLLSGERGGVTTPGTLTSP